MIILGLLMVIAGVVLPMLMVVKVLESTFFLNFFSYFLSMAGTFLGIIGAAMYVRFTRGK
jgi:hypothetical protein